MKRRFSHAKMQTMSSNKQLTLTRLSIKKLNKRLRSRTFSKNSQTRNHKLSRLPFHQRKRRIKKKFNWPPIALVCTRELIYHFQLLQAKSPSKHAMIRLDLKKKKLNERLRRIMRLPKVMFSKKNRMMKN